MHHTPGRLRFKPRLLVSDRRLAAQCAVYARSLQGVRTVSLNEATGSFLIHYCPDTLEPASLVVLLNMHGGFGRLGLRMACSGPVRPVVAGNAMGGAVVEAAIATTVELCVGAFVKRLF